MILATLITIALNAQAQPSPPSQPASRPSRAGMPGGPASAPATGAKAPIERDFIMACAISRMGMGLLNAPAFKDQKADLALRIAELAKAGMKTPEAKNTVKAAGAVTGPAKQKIWADAAKDVGLEKWQCPSIEAL